MSVKNYRFVSPGVFVNEIDNSQIPASPAGVGPVIIGRAEKGPALRPTTVDSFEEFVNVFGTPQPGNSGDDVWRQGANTTAATYGMYAAQAYLRNSAPLTYIRLLGSETDNASGGGEAGCPCHLPRRPPRPCPFSDVQHQHNSYRCSRGDCICRKYRRVAAFW